MKLPKVKTMVITIATVGLLAVGGFGTLKVYQHFNPKDEYKEQKVTIDTKVKNQSIVDKETVILSSKSVVKLIGEEVKAKKEHKYQDSAFKLKLTEIGADSSVTERFFVGIWNGLKQKATNTVTREYFQTGYYTAKYGLDAKKNPLHVISVNEQTGVVKIEKPVVSRLGFEMPYDEMKIEAIDKTDLEKGRIKLTKEFTDKDRQLLYKDLKKRTLKEVDQKTKEMAQKGTEQAIEDFFKMKDKNIKIKFVDVEKKA